MIYCCSVAGRNYQSQLGTSIYYIQLSKEAQQSAILKYFLFKIIFFFLYILVIEMLSIMIRDKFFTNIKMFLRNM
jgi:hypothetical protein